jgi:hypothetical protein
VNTCASHAAQTRSHPRGRWAVLRTPRGRVPGDAPDLRGRQTSGAHRGQGGDAAACAPSWRTPGHPQATRVATAGPGVLTCGRAAGRSGHGAAWAQAARASTGACPRAAPWAEVGGADAALAQGWSVRARVARGGRDAWWRAAPDGTAAGGTAP